MGFVRWKKIGRNLVNLATHYWPQSFSEGKIRQNHKRLTQSRRETTKCNLWTNKLIQIAWLLRIARWGILWDSQNKRQCLSWFEAKKSHTVGWDRAQNKKNHVNVNQSQRKYNSIREIHRLRLRKSTFSCCFRIL